MNALDIFHSESHVAGHLGSRRAGVKVTSLSESDSSFFSDLTFTEPDFAQSSLSPLTRWAGRPSFDFASRSETEFWARSAASLSVRMTRSANDSNADIVNGSGALRAPMVLNFVSLLIFANNSSCHRASVMKAYKEYFIML